MNIWRWVWPVELKSNNGLAEGSDKEAVPVGVAGV